MSDRPRSRVLIVLSFLLAAAVAGEQAWAKGRGGGGKGGGKSRASFSGSHGGGHSGHVSSYGKGHGGKYSGQPTKAHGGGHSAYQTTHDKGHGGAVKHSDSQVGKNRQPGTKSGNWRHSERDGTWNKGSRWSADSAQQGSHRWSMQRANEERKLTHRLETAKHLDRIADQTGNNHLHDTAERMRQKAQQLHDKRIEKNRKDPLPDLPDGDGWVHDRPWGDEIPGTDGGRGIDDALHEFGARHGLEDVVDGPIDFDGPGPDVGDVFPPRDHLPSPPGVDLPGDHAPFGRDGLEKLTGRENALYRQIRNEERKLARRTEAAERLWDAYDATDDERFSDAADLLQRQALDHYEKRMEAIRSFQQRHGLPDPFGGEWNWPDIDPGLPGDPIDGVDALIETVQ